MDRINELKEQIVKYANLYYTGQSTISDAEFDKLVDELRSLDPNDTLLTTTGWGYNVSGKKKVKHPLVNVGGLMKNKINPDTKLRFDSGTPKYDGASVELIYFKGQLVSAISRGNGEYGQNITDKLVPIVGTEIHINNFSPELVELINNCEMSISGEFILSKESFKKNYPGEISYRNIPSGFLNRDTVTPEECKKFSFQPYRVNAVRVFDDKKYIGIEILRQRNLLQSFLDVQFEVEVPYVESDQSGKTYQELMDYFSSKSDFNFDGFVGCNKPLTDIEVIHDETGYATTYVYKYDEVAYKIVTDCEDVEVTNIAWNLTRTRRLVPVVEFDPVELSGAMVQRATGHNASYIVNNGIGVGAIVRITRSGEVIPYILEVVSKVTPQSDYECPHCHSKLKWRGADLVCDNADCPSATYNNIYHWLSCIGWMDGAGGSLYNAIIEYGEISKISDFYEKDIDWSGIEKMDGIGGSKVEMVLEIIKRLHRPIEFDWMLSSSNLRGVSSTTAYKLRMNTNLEECIKNNTPKLFTVDNVKGVGSAVWQTIEDNWNILLENYRVSNIIDHSNDGKEVIPESKPIEKLKICITGKLKYGTRSKVFKDFDDVLEEVDIKNAEYLVTNNPDSGSAKNKKAVELGVKIITEEELFELDQMLPFK